MISIATLLTCHNRCDKTVHCLRSLKEALLAYNDQHEEKIKLEVYLTDDGCTDGTADAAREVFPDNKALHILQGDGNLYWAGGMRFCWCEAMKRHLEWDYYLLINDDTEMFPILFDELLEAESYSLITYNKYGIISGECCSSTNHDVLTYGGHVFTNRFLGRVKHVWSEEKPVMCDTVNANVLLVPVSVVDIIGMFYKRYSHSYADYDYAFTARRKGIPVLLTSSICAACDYDHNDENQKNAKKLLNMTVAERKAYYKHPLHSLKDGLRYNWRITPFKTPGVVILNVLRVYFPGVYYKVHG